MDRDSHIDQLIDSVKSLNINRQSQTPNDKDKRTLKPWFKSELKTGIIYDDFMTQHKCLWGDADEKPERYQCVKDRFEFYNLIEQCKKLDSVAATEEQVLLVHDKKYHDSVKSTKGEKDIEKLKAFSELYDGLYMTEDSYDIAMLAAGSSVRITDAVLDQNDIKNGFALVRTPGHHAQQDKADGYCIFNNAAIIARHAIKNRGLKRVLIVDWDVHHGQGTQSFFYDDPSVLYVSIHRYERGKFWPELIESNFNFTGRGAGKGFNLNLPLNQTGCNDADFLLMWFNVIMPVAYEFDPELVIISAGYDAAIGCPEGKMRVKPTTYSALCHSLMSLADGKLVALLEGGYNLLSLAEGAAMTLRTLLGYPAPRIDESIVEMIPHNSVIQTILDVIWAIRPQWKMLQIQGTFERFRPDESKSIGGDTEGRPKYSPIVYYEGQLSNPANRPEKFPLDGVCCPKDHEEQKALCAEILSIIQRTDLSLPQYYNKNRTLLIYDDDMMRHECLVVHPEKPSRYSSILKRLKEAGLHDRCSIGQSRRATEDEIGLVHDRDYIADLKSTQTMTDKQLVKFSNKLDSIYVNRFTYDCALLAAGCVLEAVDKVLSRVNANAFALIRPPGHHASGKTAAGFCFFNNVVVAARYAQNKYPESCKKILIVDYDFHHGNGVQRLVQDDESILYVSLHGYEDGNEYPMEQISNYNSGSKNIINIPWNDDIMTDSEYLLAYQTIVLPAAYEFNPDLVLVSSGFDAATRDPLGTYRLSPAVFGHFVHHLLPLASGKLVACLEGGYNLESISESSAHVVSILLGDPPKSLQGLKAPSPAAILSMRNVLSYHKSDYKLLCMDYDLPRDQVED